MSTLVLRNQKGSALTFEEGDANFTNLNTDKLEDITQQSIGDLSDVDVAGIVQGNVLVWDNDNSKFVAGTASADGIVSVQDDPTPKLGGDLDVNNHSIVSTSDGDIVLAPSGVGKISLAGLLWPNDGQPTTVSQTFVVTVVNEGQGNIYQIDGVSKPILNLVRGGVYTFDQSDASNLNHPLAFRDDANVSWTQGVVTTGTAGQPGAQVVFTVPENAPNSLKYYCTVHGNFMGNQIVISSTASITGTVIEIDAVRDPNTIELSTFEGIAVGNQIVFTGTDVVSAGLTEDQVYYIVSDLGTGIYEISDEEINPPITLTAVSPITDFNFAVAASTASTLVGGEVLTYNSDNILTWNTLPAAGATELQQLTDVDATTAETGDTLVYDSASNQWTAQTIQSGISSIVEDTAPQLGGALDVNGQSIVSVSSGNIVLAPNGTGKSRVNNINYNETPHSLGTTSGTIAPNIANGNVQSITLNGNLTLNAFTSPIAGQSVTLIVNTNGTGRTLTSSMKFAGGEKTLSITNTVDILSVFFDGTTYFASLSTDFN